VGKSKKVVIDTNVFISAFGWGGTPLKVVQLLEKEVIRNCVSEKILNELYGALNYHRIAFPVKFQTNILEFVLAYSDIYEPIFVNPKNRLNITPDPDDNQFIECALSAKAKFIITGDKSFLSLKKFEAIRIVTPRYFLQYITSD
jgi:uncharacterized protein